jgi:hypothetical protein
MSINTINISTIIKLHVLARLLNNNELFHIACSKAGLSVAHAKELMKKNK